MLCSGDVSAQLTPGPQPTAAYVSGSGWSQSFKDHLASTRFGSADYGRRVPLRGPVGGVQPWVNLDRVSVSFNYDVVVEADDLTVRGVNVASYPVASVRYDFDPVSFTGTATWTLARPILADRVVAEVDGDEGGVYGRTSHVQLDGDGDIAPGGDLRIRLDVLSGDSDTSTVVNAFDLAWVKQTLNRHPGDGVTGAGAYSFFADVTADGRINALDIAAVKRRLGTRLTAIEPSLVVSPAGRDNGLSVTDELFGSQPVLP